MAKKKNAAAVTLGRRGGNARLKKMTPEQRSAIAKKAANARWAKAKDDADRPTVARAAKANKPKGK